MGTHISFENVSKSFKQRTALNGLSFQVNHGDVFALLGPNGAGKTTSLRILLKLLEYDAGVVSFNGSGKSPSRETRISAVLDDHGLYGSLSAYDNIKYFANLYGIADAKDKIDDLLRTMEIDDLKSVSVKDFSSGMLRRCALARALVVDPSLLIVDEPTKNLDPQGKEDI
jgi:ABC-2 type transport system ATP-binding protein